VEGRIRRRAKGERKRVQRLIESNWKKDLTRHVSWRRNPAKSGKGTTSLRGKEARTGWVYHSEEFGTIWGEWSGLKKNCADTARCKLKKQKQKGVGGGWKIGIVRKGRGDWWEEKQVEEGKSSM